MAIFARAIYRDDMSRALRDFAVAIFLWNDILEEQSAIFDEYRLHCFRTILYVELMYKTVYKKRV